MSLYSTVFENVLLPSHNLIRGRKYVRHRRFLEESQWWPREKLSDFQWTELQALLTHVFQSVPYYQRKYADAGIRLQDIKTREDFARLPILTREEVNAHREELCSTAYRGKLLPHATGGSSGVPLRLYRTVESYDWRCAATDRVYSWTSCRLGERAVYLWGAPVGAISNVSQVKKKVFEFIRRELMFSTFAQSPELWNGIYASVIRYRPKLLVGYVSSLEEFSRFLLDTGRQVPSVKAVISAAEPLYEPSRERISAALGAPVFNTYGSREFMSIAGECELHQGLHINSENLLVEAAKQVKDGPSEILVTDLHNFGMPFVRYTIGDIGLMDDSPCPCGRGLPRLRSVQGRVLDTLQTRDGGIVVGEWFPHVLKEIQEIREYQVRQISLDQIVISVVLSAPLASASRKLLDEEVRKTFGESTQVQLQAVGELPHLPSGKRRVVIGMS